MDGGRIRQLLTDAKSHADVGDMLLASQLYTKATEIEPNNAAAWYGLGVVQTARGFPDDSRLAFEKANMLDPEHAPTAANLAVLLENIDPVRSYELATMAVEKLGSIQQLSIIIESRNESIVDSEAVKLTDIEQNEEAPMLESREINDDLSKSEEIPIIESRKIEDQEDILLEARSVETIDEVINNAKEMLATNRANEALSSIRSRLETDGSMNYELWSLCATTLYMIGHNNEALEAIEYAIAIGDDRAKTHFNHSQILKELGKIEQSLQSISNALISDPEHINSLISMGEIKIQQNETDEAISFWERAYRISSDEELMIRIQKAKDSVSEDEEIESGEELIAESIDEKISIARALTEDGDYVNSVKAWKRLLEVNRDSPDIWNGMADSLSAAGHVDRALQCRQKANSLIMEERDDSISEPEEELDLIAAGKEAQEIIENTDNSPEVDANISIEWYNKGINLLAEERGSEALSSFEKAIGGAPKEELELRVKAQAGRGHALYQMGKYGDSIRSYHTAISMDPEGVSGKLLYNMGSSYASLELFQDAVKCFIQAIDRGLDDNDRALCKKQLSRCKILAKEQARRASR
jgi:tetratricopeptide (TPR) repeat protein|tara:strand:+ start:4853 stop:6610 length:1758 start_codon:yes stop_codon:yes gene_type:complete